MAITAEAATKQIGDLKATVTHSGVSIDVSWSEIKNADSYNIMVMYSTDAIPFNISSNTKFFAIKEVKAGGALSISIPTVGLPLDINGKKCHYNVQITTSNVGSDYYNLYFDSLDNLDQTDFSGGISTSSKSSKEEFVTETDKDGNKVITKYNGNGGDVVIPNGVVGISKGAFAAADTVTSVTFPKSCYKIDVGNYGAKGL